MIIYHEGITIEFTNYNFILGIIFYIRVDFTFILRVQNTRR